LNSTQDQAASAARSSQWSARGTQDGSVAARSFYIRDGGTRQPYDAAKGMVLDIAR
jgi:hypothetical protein